MQCHEQAKQTQKKMNECKEREQSTFDSIQSLNLIEARHWSMIFCLYSIHC